MKTRVLMIKSSRYFPSQFVKLILVYDTRTGAVIGIHWQIASQIVLRLVRRVVPIQFPRQILLLSGGIFAASKDLLKAEASNNFRFFRPTANDMQLIMLAPLDLSAVVMFMLKVHNVRPVTPRLLVTDWSFFLQPDQGRPTRSETVRLDLIQLKFSD
jgi:hypothetical protein